MSTSFLSDAKTVLTVVGKLLEEKPPVLVEVRFPKMGTSSDWFLCENAAALDAILDRQHSNPTRQRGDLCVPRSRIGLVQRLARSFSRSPSFSSFETVLCPCPGSRRTRRAQRPGAECRRTARRAWPATWFAAQR